MGSPKSTATSNYTAATVFPRLHNVAVTYVFIFRGAARRIYKLWRLKTWGCRTVFDLMSHGDLRAFLRRPYNFQGRRKVPARRPQGDCRGALRRTCGQTDGNEWVLFIYIYFFFTSSFVSACRIATANVEMKKVITPRYNSTATLRPVKYSHMM